MDRGKIVQQIEAVLRRTREGANATEAEVEQAVAFAERLMKKHNIEMAEVLDAGESPYTSKDIVELCVWDKSKKPGRYVRNIIATACKITGSRHYILGPRMYAYGIKEDCETAKVIIEELVVIVRTLARHTCGKGWGPKQRSYALGFSVGLWQKFSEPAQEKQTAGLIVLKNELIDAKAIELDLKPARKARTVKVTDDYFTGLDDGKDFELKSGHIS